MRSLTFFWVIMMMTMSITSVIAQNSIIVDYETIDGKENQRVVPSEQKKSVSITYADKSKPQIPESLLGQYLQKGEVSFCGKKKITGYSDLIFSVTTETLHQTWTKSDSGVVYSTRVVSGKQTAWWMICLIVSIFLIIVAQLLENTTIVAVIVSVVTIAVFAVSVAVNLATATSFIATTTSFIATTTIAAFAAAFAAAATFDISVAFAIIPEKAVDSPAIKRLFIFFYVCMILSIILMYCAF